MAQAVAQEGGGLMIDTIIPIIIEKQVEHIIGCTPEDEETEFPLGSPPRSSGSESGAGV